MKRPVQLVFLGLIFVFAVTTESGSATEPTAKSYLRIESGKACGTVPVGTIKTLHNTNTGRAIRATIKIENPGNSDVQDVVPVAAGGKEVLGCSSNSGGGFIKYSVVGAEYVKNK